MTAALPDAMDAPRADASLALGGVLAAREGGRATGCAQAAGLGGTSGVEALLDVNGLPLRRPDSERLRELW